MDRVVALKILTPRLVRTPVALARFQREVKAAARLNHAAVMAFQWSSNKQAGIEAESPLENFGQAEERGWQLEDQIRVRERGFGRDDALVLDTQQVVATWLGSLFPWVG